MSCDRRHHPGSRASCTEPGPIGYRVMLRGEPAYGRGKIGLHLDDVSVNRGGDCRLAPQPRSPPSRALVASVCASASEHRDCRRRPAHGWRPGTPGEELSVGT